jgi:hypothetical protein
MWHKNKIPKKNKYLIILTNEGYEVAVYQGYNGKDMVCTSVGVFKKSEVIKWKYLK